MAGLPCQDENGFCRSFFEFGNKNVIMFIL